MQQAEEMQWLACVALCMQRSAPMLCLEGSCQSGWLGAASAQWGWP